MTETVKKSRIVSEDDLEGTLMEEFNLRLKNCLSQDSLQTEEMPVEEERLYENVGVLKKTTETISTKRSSHSFIETEKREQTVKESSRVSIEQDLHEFSNGHAVSKTEENIYENIETISKSSSSYTDIQQNIEHNSSNTEAILEDLTSEDQPDRTEFSDRSRPSFTLLSATSLDTQELSEAKSVKDRMFLSSDDTSTLLFTQTVTSPMLTPSEENVDFLKGFRRESSTNNSPKDGSQSEESPKTNGQPKAGPEDYLVVQDADSEIIGDIEDEDHSPPAEKLQNQIQENIYENLETMNESIYENVDDLRKTSATDCFNRLDGSLENSACLEDSEPISEDVPEIVSQIEQRKTPALIDDDDVTEISDVCSLDKQVSDSDSSNLIDGSRTDEHGYPRNLDRFGIIQDFIDSERTRESEDPEDIPESDLDSDPEKPQKFGYNNSEVMEYIAMTEEPKNRSNVFDNDEPSATRDEYISDVEQDFPVRPNESGDFDCQQVDEGLKSPTQTRIVDEIVKNYVSSKGEANQKNREKDTETVPFKIVQNLTTQFMKNGDEVDPASGKNKKVDANQLKSVDIMKQINMFEHKDEDGDSTQITESFVETTTFDSSMGEKAMKKKKSKKSRKEEKENISVNDTNLDSFYNVNVKSLCRSFGDLTKIDEKCKQMNPQIRYTIDRTRSKSLSDTYLTSNQKYFDKVFSRVSVKALKEKFITTSTHGPEKSEKRFELSLLHSSSQNIAVLKSSFSKFDALQKKNLLHVRSSDSTKAQEKFNGTTIDMTNCKCCGKQVFQMEQMKAEKAIWHKNCFRCHECSKQLNVDTYESHEGTLYCKPHFKALFAPKAVDDTDEPPSDKPDLGLEELQSLNVKERFQVFEQHQSNDSTLERTQVNVKRSPSILSKLAKFQSKGMDIGVADDSLNGIPIEESSSEEEQEEEIPEGEDPDLVRAKRVQKEKPFHFTGMSDVKNKWEHGESDGRDERREERKQEIQSIRNKLFMGKQGKMKEAYQEAVMKSESSVNLKKEEIKVCDTKTIKERFEKGEVVHEMIKDGRDEDDQEIFESEISKNSRSLFLQLDANASKAPHISPVSPPKLDVKKAREGSTPEREVYHDPDVIRAEEIVEDSVIAKETHTATKMLNKFRQMEESLSKEQTPQGPKPLKRFTPPPEPTRDEESSSEEGSGSEEETEEVDNTKVPDEDLLEAQKAARAKHLRAKFEKWEAQEIKREQNNSSINIMEEYGEEQSQIESTKLLRARFESMRDSHSEVNKQPRVKVNRFV